MNYFNLSANRRWGLVVLVLVVTILFLVRSIMDQVPSEDTVIAEDITPSWLRDAYDGENGLISPESIGKPEPGFSQQDTLSGTDAAAPILTAFDPNTAPADQMLASGVPAQSVRRIISYRNKGGTFYNKEKLLDFGIDDQTFRQLSPYIIIKKSRPAYGRSSSSSGQYTSTYNTYQRPAEPLSVNINNATQEELMGFKGIGPGYSKRIINYRDKLGGYMSVEQLREVYGLPDTTYEHIKDRIVIDTSAVRKININTASLEELIQHPYIRKFMAEHIIRLRDDIEQFNSLQDLRQIPLINDEKYRKIVPYISL